jgi:hypothetical protein
MSGVLSEFRAVLPPEPADGRTTQTFRGDARSTERKPSMALASRQDEAARRPFHQ